mmetsp:Transcript_9484/g.21704  ORF Transcript_9484/g.21704 Transcript_9484/m.21704 type:complete len:230 (-) Transcript_9484:1952-2641(-)
MTQRHTRTWRACVLLFLNTSASDTKIRTTSNAKAPTEPQYTYSAVCPTSSSVEYEGGAPKVGMTKYTMQDNTIWQLSSALMRHLLKPLANPSLKASLNSVSSSGLLKRRKNLLIFTLAACRTTLKRVPSFSFFISFATSVQALTASGLTRLVLRCLPPRDPRPLAIHPVFLMPNMLPDESGVAVEPGVELVDVGGSPSRPNARGEFLTAKDFALGVRAFGLGMSPMSRS